MSNRKFSMRVKSEPETQFGAFALISADHENQPYYLLQWNKKWQLFNLIGGKLDNARGDNYSLARTIYRELEEELGLRPEEECLIVNLIQEVEMRQFSHREQRYKDYFFGLFEVDLFPRLAMSSNRKISAARWLSTGNINEFISRHEIENLSTRDGRPISVTARRILQAIEEIPPYNYHNDGSCLLPLYNGLTNDWKNDMQSPDSIFCKLLPDGTILNVNNGITQVTGYHPDEIIGYNWWRIFFPGNGGYQVNQLYRLIQAGHLKNHEMTLTTKKRQLTTLYFNIKAEFSSNGRLHHIKCASN